MFKHVECDRVQTNCSSADGFETFTRSFFIKVEYYRLVEYHFKWKSLMSSTRSSKQQKTSKRARKSPSPNEGVIKRKVRSSRLRSRLKEAESVSSTVNTDVAPNHDIEIVDDGVDQSVDGDDDTSSIGSGPSLSYIHSIVKLSSPQALCSACRKLHQKAKRLKAPMKDKLLDNDPTSLTCDQWVLLKKWRPRRLCKARGELYFHVDLIKKRLGKLHEQCAGERESSTCSRPHVFIQRNLRQCVRMSAKRGSRKTRRKRAREEEQGSRIAKLQRLHSSSLHQYNRDSTDESGPYSPSGLCSSPSFQGCSEQDISDQPDTDLVVELIPSAVTSETTKSGEVPHNQKVPKRKVAGFRDLLTQLRGNSSMIVRETH